MHRAARTAGLGAAVLLPSLAWAHSPIKGLNHFYNGVLHPVLVPAHLLLLLALGLFIGQTTRREQAPQVAWLCGGTLLGLLGAGLAGAGLPWLEPLALGAAALVGLLVAVRPQALPRAIRWVLVGGVALLVGLDSAQDGLAGNTRLLALAGSALGIWLLPALALTLSEGLSARPWQVVGQRVLGSWIAAASLLVLALMLKSATLPA